VDGDKIVAQDDQGSYGGRRDLEAYDMLGMDEQQEGLLRDGAASDFWLARVRESAVGAPARWAAELGLEVPSARRRRHARWQRSTIMVAGPVANNPGRRSGITPTRDQRGEATHY
jgi:hypothetical protein